MRYFVLFLLYMMLPLVAFSQHDPSKAELRDMKKMLSKLEGSYLNTRFAEANRDNPLLQEQQLRVFTIWEDEKHGVWFYVGWFHPNLPRHPLAERFCNVMPVQEDSFLVYFYQLPEDNELELQWEVEKPYSNLTPAHLKMDCVGSLVDRGKGKYELLPQKRPCRSSKSESFYFSHYHIIFEDTKLILFNQFYDQHFKLIFSYPEGNHFELRTRKRADF